MALCDYRLCDRCGGKAFYDANLNYGDPGATRVRGQHYTLDHVGDWAVLCQTCAETHAVVIVSHETGAPRLEDGWRRCAVGHRTTQSCGMAEEARAQERQRIVERVCALRDTDKTPAQCATVQGNDSPCAARERARLHALLTAWFAQWQHQYRVNPSAYDAGALGALDDVLDLLEEDATHE